MPGDGGAESPPAAAASAARQRRSTAGISTLPGSIFLTFITILALAHDKAPDRLKPHSVQEQGAVDEENTLPATWSNQAFVENSGIQVLNPNAYQVRIGKGRASPGGGGVRSSTPPRNGFFFWWDRSILVRGYRVEQKFAPTPETKS